MKRDHEMIKLLPFDYESDELNTPAKQENYLLTKLQAAAEKTGKVAILYSANNDQAEAMYQFYHSPTEKKFSEIISGSSKNQAAAFKELSTSLCKIELLDKIHILPISTMKHGGNSALPRIKDIIRDLSNVQQYLENGWQVFVLTNTKPSAGKYQIGGGKSKYFYSSEKKVIPFGEVKLSCGHFVERVIDRFIDIYNSDQPSAEKQKESKAALAKILNPYQMMFFEERDDKKYGFKVQRPDSLCDYVISALQKHHLNVTSEKIKKITFSPSWNLRIEFNPAYEDDIASIEKMMASYSPMLLREARKNQAVVDPGLQEDNNVDFTLSILAENVFLFFLDYCNISPEHIAYFYAKKIEINPRNGLGTLAPKKALAPKKTSVVITPFYILFDDKTFTLEKARNEKKFGVRHQNLNKLGTNIFRHPEKVEEIIPEIMRELKGVSSSAHYRYHLISDVSAISTVMPSLTAQLMKIKENKIVPAKLGLHKLIWEIYNSLTHGAAILYKNLKIEDFFAKDSDVRKKIGGYHSAIGERIGDYIFSNDAENSTEMSVLRYWIYVQVAFLSHIKGNVFLCSAIILSLNQKKMSKILDLFPDDFKKLFQVIEGTVLEEGKFPDASMVSTVVKYNKNFGPALPLLANFSKWKEYAGEEKEKGFEMIDERLSPILNSIHAVPLQKTNFQLNAFFIANENKAEFKFEAQKELISNLCEFSLWVEMVSSARKLAGTLKFNIPETLNDERLLEKLLSSRGEFFSDVVNPIVRIIEKDVDSLNLIKSILKYNFFTARYFKIEEIQEALQSSDNQEDIDQLLERYLMGVDNQQSNKNESQPKQPVTTSLTEMLGAAAFPADTITTTTTTTTTILLTRPTRPTRPAGPGLFALPADSVTTNPSEGSVQWAQAHSGQGSSESRRVRGSLKMDNERRSSEKRFNPGP